MRAFLKASAVAAALLFSASSAHAVAVITVDPAGPDGSISGSFGNTGLGATFDDTLTFFLPAAGVTSGTISSTLTSTATDVNFTTVTLNGTPFDVGSTGNIEFRFLNPISTLAGLQTLRIIGTAGGEGSYGGTFSFSPAAVPEPATWAMMIIGFGMVGAGIRKLRDTRGVPASA
jgi:hypothetical protein